MSTTEPDAVFGRLQMTEEDLSRPLTESVFIFRVRWMFMVSAISLVVLLFSTSHDPRSELREPGRSAGQG